MNMIVIYAKKIIDLAFVRFSSIGTYPIFLFETCSFVRTIGKWNEARELMFIMNT